MPNNLPRLTAPAQNKPGIGIVHLGIGAFFRAHGAIYIAEAMKKSGGDWGVLGVSLKRPVQRDLLEPQGFAYTAVEMGPSQKTAQVISVLQDILVAPEAPEKVLAAMADPNVKIVSLTVTEKGYCHEPSTGALNGAHPDIVADLADASAPASAIGFIVRALSLRRDAGIVPFTVMSCDNLPENGKVLRGVVLELASLINPELATWIASEGAFPSTMVDRIVPATKPEDIDMLGKLNGTYDASPVMHEPFRQWVIEDNFVNNDRPDLGAVGAQMVSDVAPFEDMKLRCLNGTHSALAYLGYLAGFETISETVANPDFAAFATHLWNVEIIPGLAPPDGEDLPRYARALLERYRNPGLQHRTWQIAMDGSQKLPQRLLGTISDNLAAGRKSDGLILAVAGWMRYVSAVDEKGHGIDVRDPFSAQLKAIHGGSQTVASLIDTLLAVEGIFPANLARNQDFRAGLVAAYERLNKVGSLESVKWIVT